MTEEPYRLFDYYRYADRELFFGRDEEVARMVGDILSARLLALFAPSGSGKSSLLRAGVQPALEKRNFEAVFTRVGEDPVASIVTAIETLDSTPSRGAPDLVTALTGRTRPVVVVIDQFEELFIQFGDESRKRKDFPVKLGEALFDPTLRVYFVLSLRSDYFVCLNEFRDAIPTIFHNNANLELRPFDDAAARDAIVGPSEQPGSGFTWEKGLPERFVRDLKAREINPHANGVLPITLQVVCHTLWSRLPEGCGEITANSYDAEGGAAAIIERRIFQPLEATPARDRRLLCRLLRELITKDGTKRIQSVNRLHDALGSGQQKRTDALLARLNQALLLREETSRGETWVELRHDYLAARMKPWLDEEERRLDARRRRNNTLATIACTIAAGVGVWLWNDYHTYTAEIGTEEDEPEPEDELVVTRRRPLGMLGAETDFPLWRFRVNTGFSRDLLKDGGIRHNTFNAPNAPSDWTAIGEHLTKPVRDRLIFASNLEEVYSSYFDAIECPDISYYAAADDKVLSFAVTVLGTGNAKAKSSAAAALAHLGANLPAALADAVVEALLAALKDNDFYIKRSAAAALRSLGANLPAARADVVVEALLAALNDNDSEVKSSAAAALRSLGANLPATRADAVVEALLTALKDNEANVKRSAAAALGSLGANLPAARADVVIEALLAALKDNDFYIKRSAAAALRSLGANLPAARADAVVEALLTALKDIDSDVKSSAAAALGSLGANLPPARADAVVEALLAALKGFSSDVRSSAAAALGSLGANLPAARADAVVETLLAALNDNDSDVKGYAAAALGSLGANVPAARADVVVEALLAALKDDDFDVKSSAATALGRLKEAASRTQAETAIIRLSCLLAARGADDFDPSHDSAQRCIRQLTAHDSTRPSELLLQDLESDASRQRIMAIHMLARRSLSPEQLQKIRQLRDDPKRRPWVQMAALDTLMEIEREKDAVARDKKEAEEKAKKEKESPETKQ